MNTLQKKKALCAVIFSIYILVVLNLTVFRFNFYYDERQLNLTLFTDLIKVFNDIGIGHFLRLLLGNIGWFVPFGFLLAILLKRECFFKILIAAFLFSFTIETVQYIFRKGVAELDDLILNVLGAAIGYGLYKLLQKMNS